MRISRLTNLLQPKCRIDYSCCQVDSKFSILGYVSTEEPVEVISVCLEEELCDFYYVSKGPILKRIDNRKHQISTCPISNSGNSRSYRYDFKFFASNDSINCRFVQRQYKIKVVWIARGRRHVQFQEVKVNKCFPCVRLSTQGTLNGKLSYKIQVSKQLYKESDYLIKLNISEPKKVQIDLIQTYAIRVERDSSSFIQADELSVSEVNLFKGDYNPSIVIPKHKFRNLQHSFVTANISCSAKLKIVCQGIRFLVNVEIVNAAPPPPEYDTLTIQLPRYTSESLPPSYNVIELD